MGITDTAKDRISDDDAPTCSLAGHRGLDKVPREDDKNYPALPPSPPASPRAVARPHREPCSPIPLWGRRHDDAADDFFSILARAETPEEVRRRAQRAFGGRRPSARVAEVVLDGVMDMVEGRSGDMGAALEGAVARAEEAARIEFDFGRRRPTTGRDGYAREGEDGFEGALTIVAVGALALLTEHWMVLDPLGFQEVGPVVGSIAAWWNLQFLQWIPKDSMPSFFERLGVVWVVDENLVIIDGPFDGGVVETPVSPVSACLEPRGRA